jgi:DNA polymerase I-like protein with 3'-5' exonuclease and polymerase domains
MAFFINKPKHFIDGKRIAFDTETTGLDLWHNDKPFAFSFTNEALEDAYFEFDVNPLTREPIIQPNVLNKIARLLEDPAITKVCHNRKFDERAMDRGYGIKLLGPRADTMIKAFVCNTREPTLGLKFLGDKYCAISKQDQQDLKKAVVSMRRRGAKVGWNIKFDIVKQPDGTIKKKAQTAADYWLPGTIARCYPVMLKPLEDRDLYAGLCGLYAVGDTQRTMLLDMMYEPILDELHVRHIYEDMELALYPVIYDMETRGPCTDTAVLDRQMHDSKAVMDEIYPRLAAVAGEGFRPSAADDVRRLFYEVLEFPIKKWTKGGKETVKDRKTGEIRAKTQAEIDAKKQPAVDKFVILDHIDDPVVRDLAIWKGNNTAYTGFFSKFRRQSIPDTFGGQTALHCEYRQVGGDQKGDRGGVATGRLSSANPNLQNVMTPENTMAVHPLHVRPAFIPRPGMCWLCIDYEGMEVFVYAIVSGEPTMMTAINAGRSIHDEMTNTVWGGKDNEEALKQAIRALSLDGTGMHTSEGVDTFWREFGITDKNVLTLTLPRKYQLADIWLSRYDYDQVRAQAGVGRKNSKTTIKSLTFLKIYCGGAEKATLLLKCPIDEAQRTLDLYDTKFPRINEYNYELIAEAKANGFITSQWGRRLEINPDKPYQAVNYMIQGSSADLMKMSLIRLDKWYKESGFNAYLLLTIHDEIVTELSYAELTKPFIREACRIMCDTQGVFPIPMKVEAKVVTDNWSIKRKVAV